MLGRAADDSDHLGPVSADGRVRFRRERRSSLFAPLIRNNFSSSMTTGPDISRSVSCQTSCVPPPSELPGALW